MSDTLDINFNAIVESDNFFRFGYFIDNVASPNAKINVAVNEGKKIIIRELRGYNANYWSIRDLRRILKCCIFDFMKLKVDNFDCWYDQRLQFLTNWTNDKEIKIFINDKRLKILPIINASDIVPYNIPKFVLYLNDLFKGEQLFYLLSDGIVGDLEDNANFSFFNYESGLSPANDAFTLIVPTLYDRFVYFKFINEIMS